MEIDLRINDVAEPEWCEFVEMVNEFVEAYNAIIVQHFMVARWLDVSFFNARVDEWNARNGKDLQIQKMIEFKN